MNLREEFDNLAQEIPAVMKTPRACIISFLLGVSVAWTAAYFVYSNRIASKDATIQTVEHERDGYKSHAERLEKDVERLKQNRPVIADSALTLKTEAINLAKQLEAEVEKWTPQDVMEHHPVAKRRFGQWVEDTMTRLDRHGQWSESLKDLFFNFDRWGKVETIRAAKEIKTLAENLKE